MPLGSLDIEQGVWARQREGSLAPGRDGPCGHPWKRVLVMRGTGLLWILLAFVSEALFFFMSLLLFNPSSQAS